MIHDIHSKLLLSSHETNTWTGRIRTRDTYLCAILLPLTDTGLLHTKSGGLAGLQWSAVECRGLPPGWQLHVR
jgi:hypothetical protein